MQLIPKDLMLVTWHTWTQNITHPIIPVLVAFTQLCSISYVSRLPLENSNFTPHF